jgi:hypothetical protein
MGLKDCAFDLKDREDLAQRLMVLHQWDTEKNALTQREFPRGVKNVPFQSGGGGLCELQLQARNRGTDWLTYTSHHRSRLPPDSGRSAKWRLGGKWRAYLGGGYGQDNVGLNASILSLNY